MPVCLQAQVETQVLTLENLSTKYKSKENAEQKKLQQLTKKYKWEKVLLSENSNQIITLTGVDVQGFPIYTSTNNNTISAATTQTNKLWNGSISGYNLSGSSTNLKGKLAIWDGGVAMNTHIELNGRIINKDASSQINHTTHVAGTLIAKGFNPSAKGMAFGAEELNCYDFNNHISEMSSAASNLLLSNHSYGIIAGWNKPTVGDWEFWGNPGDIADYKFGIYNEECQMFDSISYNAPNYLIVKSSGNNKDKNGPAVGEPYKRFNASGTMVSSGNRPSGISSNNGFDIIPTYGVAKNILTVGAIEGIPSGIATLQNIKLGVFSSCGPTDDGRIKPDIVANGVDVLSSVANSTTSYDVYNGTSMATPNVTGSLFLLQELYSKKNAGSFMRASTLKALAIHTSTEAGNTPGPDYQFGWGLLNAQKAAQIIDENNTGSNRIIEAVLNNSSTYTLNVIASGVGKLMATLVWTDPAATPTTINLLNNPALKLINDLDIKITSNNFNYYPWVLDPTNQSAAATKGINFRDNVERIDIENVVPGKTYTIEITHKNNLRNGSQAFSLILSGISGFSYCNSTPLYFSGTRIDNVSFSNINNTNPTGCTQYSNFTNLTAQIEPNKSYPLNITLSSCDGSTATKFVKVYIDYNRNGNFGDVGELVATSSLLNGNSTFSTSILTPENLTENTFTLMRVVVQETNDANSITPCNSSNHGETQDYRIQFIKATTDLSIIDILNPSFNNCSNSNQLLTVRIFNNGNNSVSNIPISAIIKNGNTTVANFNTIYEPSILSGESKEFTFQTPFTSIPNTTYTILVSANVINDQNPNNNTYTSDILFSPSPTTAFGQANICNTTVNLRAFNTNSNQNYLWYNAANATTPVASGINTSSTIIASNYYLSSGFSTKIGPQNKTVFTQGDYQAKGGNYLKYTSSVPTVLEKAKFYTAFPGKVFITAADINTIFPDGTYTYKTLSTTTIDALASRPTKASGDIAGNDPSDSGFVYNINLYLPSGNHVIIVSTDSISNIFRNKNISTNPYPINYSSLFSITGNNATNQSEFYYYLYDMSLKSFDCISNKVQIVPTVAPQPTITKAGDSLVASVGINYQWLKNDSTIIGATSNNYKPTATANYSCRITDNSGCEQKSNSINFEFIAYEDALKIYPNPANNLINLSFFSNYNGFTQINIIDALGRIHLTQYFNTVIGNFNGQINISPLKNGVYTAHVTQGSTISHQIFVVAK